MPRLVNTWAASALLKFARLEVAEKRGERFLKLAAEARSRITEIPASEFSAEIKRGALVLDVREREEFLRGHIPHAAHLARGTLLQRMGYSNVKTLAGGLQGWLDAGFPSWRTSQPVED